MSKRIITIDLLSDDEELPRFNKLSEDVASLNGSSSPHNYDSNIGKAVAPVLPTLGSSRYNFSQSESYKESIDLTQDSTDSIDHILQSNGVANSPIDITTPVEKSSQSVLSSTKHYSPHSNDIAAIVEHSSDKEKALQSVLSSGSRYSPLLTVAATAVDHSNDMEKALQSVFLSGRSNVDSMNHTSENLNSNYDYSAYSQDDYGGEGGIMSYDGDMYTDFADTYESYNDENAYFDNEDSNWTSMSVNTQSSMISNVPMSQMSDAVDRGHSYSSSQVSSQKELKSIKRKEKQDQKEALRVDKMVEAFEERQSRGKFCEKEVSIIIDRTFRVGGGNKETVGLAAFIEDELLQGDYSVLISPSNIISSNLSSMRELHPNKSAVNMSDEYCGLFMWTWKKAQRNPADRTGKDVIASCGNLGERDTEVLPFVFMYIPIQLYHYFIYGDAKSIDKKNYSSPTFDSWLAAVKRALNAVYIGNYRIVLSTIGIQNAAASNGLNATDSFTAYLLLEHHIDVHYCKDRKEHADVLKQFHRSMCFQKYYVPPSELDFVPKLKSSLSDDKKEQLSQSQQSAVDIRSHELRNTWVHVLESIPGMSTPMARCLVSHYSCPAKLYRALTDERVSVKERQLLLQDKLRDGEKGRTNQPKMSKLLFKIFTSTDPEVPRPA
jgi:hypothetical protein